MAKKLGKKLKINPIRQVTPQDLPADFYASITQSLEKQFPLITIFETQTENVSEREDDD